MRFNTLKATLKTAVLGMSVLLLGAGLAIGQVTVNLAAGPSTAILPDGSAVPMWGYSCVATANCRALNGSTSAAVWSPVVITVPTGQSLTINLTNSLSFNAGANKIPTSLVIVGQLGGGLGDITQRTTTVSPDHTNAQGCVTWPIADAPPGTPCTSGTASVSAAPPTQANRVQSFSTEVAAGATTALSWANLRPGTYLIESGTHPSIQGPMGLYGILVVTTAPAGTTAGTAYGTVGSATAVSYNSEIPLLLSEIDPAQNRYVNDVVNRAGFSETAVWSGQVGACGDVTPGALHTCYPPAVNYTPLYYLINGAAFNKTSAASSLFPASPVTGVATGTTGTVLVRLVNAGLRMHVPTIVGSQTGVAVPPAAGMSLIAEDGNVLPGVPRVQSEVFMAAGKTYDVMINVPPVAATALQNKALPIFDRELSLSGNATARDSGMLAYISINGAGLPGGAIGAAAVARDDNYPSLVPCAATPCPAFTVSDPGKGLIANDTNVFGVKVLTPTACSTLAPGAACALTNGTLYLNANGTFSYVSSSAGGTPAGDTFTYQANGNSAIFATVSLGATTDVGSVTCTSPTYTAATATYINIPAPGVLAYCKDAEGFPLKVDMSTVTGAGVTMMPNGGFIATGAPASFKFQAQNSQGTHSGTTTVNLTFPTANGPTVVLVDGKTHLPLAGSPQDYRWIIEEDRTFFVDPKCTTNPLPTDGSCPTVTTNTTGASRPAVFGTNFHTSNMPLVATGCTGPNACESQQTVLDPATGQHIQAVCDAGNGVCRPDLSGKGQIAVDPSLVHLDTTKRYYISVLPGDAANPFNAGSGAACDPTKPNDPNAPCGHGMGGAPIVYNTATGKWVNPGVASLVPGSVTIVTEPTPLETAKLSVFVFEDDFPLNGEQDGGGGVDVLSPNEPGLGGFQITLFDDAGGTGDATGQPTYDMFNMPLSNALAGTIDPLSGLDACPISKDATVGVDGVTSPTGITSMIVTCPKYESDGHTLSPLAGHAIVANLYPGRYGVVATPAADRIGQGEEWLQTNTLDGQKAHDSFMRVGEPSYFQEYGPAGYHVSIGFANPKIINDRGMIVCAGGACTHKVSGKVTTARNARTPDERIYGSGTRDSFSFTQCYVSLGDPDGQDFAFTKCADDGTFSLNVPTGDFRVTIFDQWNDQIVDGISTPVRVGTGDVPMGEIGVNQWQANIYTSTFFDANGNGVRDSNEDGLALVATNIRFRDGSFSNFNNTDLQGNAGFNEVFPLFSWYVIETDATRYKNTGTHVVYDAGGPADGTCTANTAPCGTSAIAANLANTYEANPLPGNLSVPGAVYCADADCGSASILGGPVPSSASNHSTGRIDPPWVTSEGWQGFAGQNSFLEFGKKPFAVGETGGIHGHVVYYSTRPFDDPALDLQLSWTPLVPHVTVNLYKEGVAADNVTPTLTLVDSTQTSSWDDWAQGFRSDHVPNMNCPGQTTADPFFYSLQDQPNYLDWYNQQHGVVPAVTTIPYNSQFKCYDGMHMWNQLEPAPYDGRYEFPSIAGRNTSTGAPTGGTGSVTGTNCITCIANPTDGTPMLPAGKYVVELVVPPGYELVKEEDKNILIGDNYIAPVTQQFAGLGNVFILPDQAALAEMYNPYNQQNSTTVFGLPRHEGDTGSVESYWPCVGQARIVPDFLSLFPQAQEVSPFAGATRNLCDRKEVTLEDQSSVLAKFYVFTSTHAASHYTGVITDDFTSEFDPFSPQFGEKFAPAYLPVSIKDFNNNEVARVYADEFGTYNGLNYSTWEVNPPNPTGYAPTMMVVCMNDPGTGATPDNLFQAGYSDFCYELPFMPGQTGYFDTPVIPTSAYSEGYNHPDCNYPDTTPAIGSVTSQDVQGPWVSQSGHTITINTINQVGVLCGTTTISAVGDACVDSYGYSGPSINTSTFSWAKQKVVRHYSFGATAGTVTIGGVTASATWGDTQIVATVPNGVPVCSIQQQRQYGGPNTSGLNNGNAERCGELLITAANGKQSIDTVTVTIGSGVGTPNGSKHPTVLTAGQTIQSAIDAAMPGDLIIVPAGQYSEMLLMWKPVRLQGVGAASSMINANTQPAGELKLDPWRREVVCLFGLALNGAPIDNTLVNGQPKNPYDPTGTFTCSTGSGAADPLAMFAKADRLPLEAAVGWDASLNGNLAEFVQEPTLMGAYEGAAITVTAKGVDYHGVNPWTGAAVAENGAFPDGTTLLTANNCGANGVGSKNPNPSNFWCNPSSIDGLGISGSSQGGGGINVHGWGHNIQIANNRIHNNQGTLSGGITIGQGEHPGAYLQGDIATTIPGSCQTSPITNVQLPFCFDMNVNVHNNNVSLNSSEGDELFSSTPAGAGGITFCTGADNYKFSFNWVCGNMSTGDGAGIAHLGFSYNGDIEHNSILFNQSTNPTIVTNGGGLLVYAAPDVDPTCGATNDKDCAAPGLGDGSGPGLVINANLFLGNSAESGSGGGMRFQNVNGTEVTTFPGTLSGIPGNLQPAQRWYSPSVTNNIIVNNVAGLDGGGVSLQDSLAVKFVNNTVMSNDSTASAGILFNTLFAPLGSSSGKSCTQANDSQSCPQVAGFVSVPNSIALTSALPATIYCPVGHGTGGGNPAGRANGACRRFSFPLMYNDVFYQNRSFFITVGAAGPPPQNLQATVTLNPVLSQTQTGGCQSGASYWDLGVRGDLSSTTHEGSTPATPLAPTFSLVTAGYAAGGTGNSNANPGVVSQYCNGSRVPPELGSMGYTVNPGTNETNAPVPIFNLTPAATVDEGNNWINMRFGPLSLTSPVTGTVLGNYSLAAGSPAINTGTNAVNGVNAPGTDFFGNPRPAGIRWDIGAVEFGSSIVVAANVSPTSLDFGSVPQGGTSAAKTLTLANAGSVSLTGITVTFSSPLYSRPAGAAGGTCGTTLTVATGTCTINVVFSPNAAGAVPATVTITSNATVVGSPVSLTGTGTAAAVVNFSGPTPALNTGGRTVKNGVVRVLNNGSAPLTLGATPFTLVRNTGTGTWALVTPLTGATLPPLPLGATNCAAGLVVPAGGNCVVGVRYTPPAVPASVTSTATLTVSDSGAATTSQTLSITGN